MRIAQADTAMPINLKASAAVIAKVVRENRGTYINFNAETTGRPPTQHRDSVKLQVNQTQGSLN